MTDADVDGAHIASLLVTFFYTQMRGMIENGNLYLAQPPLYRLVSGKESHYAQDDIQKEELLNTIFKGKSKVDISRFKGLGEMPPPQLKETTMNPATRTLLRVTLPQIEKALEAENFDSESDLDAPVLPESTGGSTPTIEAVDDLVERLMGKNADARFNFIQENAEFVEDIDV